jgi:hypothetical protein
MTANLTRELFTRCSSHSYFFRTRVSVLVRLLTALFPVVPWFKALDVFGPGEPPVPLIVLPFESVLPAAAPAPLPLAAPPALPPEPPPELCAYAEDKLTNSRLSKIANNFMAFSPAAANNG